MPSGILFSSITRNGYTLCHHITQNASAGGNLIGISGAIVDKVPTGYDSRNTIVHERFLFHYISSQGIVYLCMAEDTFGRRVPFAFLEDVKQKFLNEYGDRALTASPETFVSFAQSTLAPKMQSYSSSSSATDKVHQVRGEIDQVRDVMVQNIERVMERGERIDLLVDKTYSLNQQAFQFKSKSTALRRKMWWKNTRITVALSLVAVLLLYFFICMGCGFPNWYKCRS